MGKLIAQGAEAKIYLENNQITKERIKKDYRLPEIDKKLRSARTRAEARLIAKAERNGISVPQIINVDEKENKLTLEYIDGTKLRDWLDTETNKDEIANICKIFGQQTRKLHDANIIHGDLTTSNVIKKESRIFFIDFGLSQVSERIEDKAVDLHLLKECFISKHFDNHLLCWNSFEDGYKDDKVLKQLKKVEARGKYKHVG